MIPLVATLHVEKLNRKKAIVVTLELAFSAAFYANATATNAVGKNAIGRASDRLGNSIRKPQNAPPSLRRKRFHSIHRLKQSVKSRPSHQEIGRQINSLYPNTYTTSD